MGNVELFVSVDPVVDNSGKHLGAVAAVTRLPAKLNLISTEIQRESQKYGELSAERRAVKTTYLSMLWLLTILILFIDTWFALFLSKQVTIPIQALAHGLEESRGRAWLGEQITPGSHQELVVAADHFRAVTAHKDHRQPRLLRP